MKYHTCLVCTLGDLSSDTAYWLSENADAVLPLSRISSAALASASFRDSCLYSQLFHELCAARLPRRGLTKEEHHPLTQLWPCPRPWQKRELPISKGERPSSGLRTCEEGQVCILHAKKRVSPADLQGTHLLEDDCGLAAAWTETLDRRGVFTLL